MYSELAQLFNVISYVCGVQFMLVKVIRRVKLVHILKYRYTVSVLLYRDA